MNGLHKNKDFLTGLMLIIFGGLFLVGSYEYTMGNAARMGPGYYPRILGGILIALGLLIASIGLKNQAKWAATEGIGWTWKPLITVVLAVILFGLTLPSLGVLVAIIILVMLAGTAAHDKNYKELAIVTVLMCLFAAVVFIWALKLQMKLFPWS